MNFNLSQIMFTFLALMFIIFLVKLSIKHILNKTDIINYKKFVFPHSTFSIPRFIFISFLTDIIVLIIAFINHHFWCSYSLSESTACADISNFNGIIKLLTLKTVLISFGVGFITNVFCAIIVQRKK